MARRFATSGDEGHERPNQGIFCRGEHQQNIANGLFLKVDERRLRICHRRQDRGGMGENIRRKVRQRGRVKTYSFTTEIRFFRLASSIARAKTRLTPHISDELKPSTRQERLARQPMIGVASIHHTPTARLAPHYASGIWSDRRARRRRNRCTRLRRPSP